VVSRSRGPGSGTNPSAPGINASRVAFKPGGRIANLTVSVAKVVTHARRSSMTSATSISVSTLRRTVGAAALAACGALSLAPAARAGTVGGAAPTVTVRYDDLKLGTEQGSLALYARIERAARQVCAVEDIRDLRAVAAAQDCRAQAIAQAVHDVHSPALAALYAARQRHG
jgi:UrcA family protein